MLISPPGMFARADATVARGCWHWLFHLQPDLPSSWSAPTSRPTCAGSSSAGRPTGRPSRSRPGYVRAFSAPGRAGQVRRLPGHPDDLDADRRAAAGQHLALPVLALWGASGLPSRLPVLDIWRRYADDVRGQAVAGCGHFLPEERPDEVAGQLLAFLRA